MEPHTANRMRKKTTKLKGPWPRRLLLQTGAHHSQQSRPVPEAAPMNLAIGSISQKEILMWDFSVGAAWQGCFRKSPGLVRKDAPTGPTQNPGARVLRVGRAGGMERALAVHSCAVCTPTALAALAGLTVPAAPGHQHQCVHIQLATLVPKAKSCFSSIKHQPRRSGVEWRTGQA